MHWKPLRRTLIGVLLAACLAFSPLSPAPLIAQQITTTTIADTLYRADGSTTGGTAVISWPQFITATGQSVQAGSISTPLTAGVLNVQLAANAGSNPMGSYYTVVYHLDDGSVTREYWVVPASTSPVKLSTIRTTVQPASVAQQNASVSYVNQAIANAVSSAAATPADGTGYVRITGDTMTGPLLLAADPVSANQAADKHYVDTALASGAGGSGQKVSLLPQATQLVNQPAGTQLRTNNLNGSEYASQYLNGQGNNGIANAATSPECTTGCSIRVEQDYNSTEQLNAGSLNNQVQIEDLRQGARHDTYINPGDPLTAGSGVGQKIDVVVTQNTGLVNQIVLSPTPNMNTLQVALEAQAGGSNLFPETLEGAVPYFKSNYQVQTIQGTFNTLGQHSLTGQGIDCYGVGDCLIGGQTIRASGGYRDEADEGAHPFDLQFSEDTRVFTGTCTTNCTTGSTSVLITPATGPGTQGEGRYLIDKNPSKVISNGQLTGGVHGAQYSSAIFTGTSFPLSVFFSTAQLAPSQANNISPGTVTLPIVTGAVLSGYSTNTAAAPSPTGIACVVDPNPAGSNLPHNYEMAPYTVIDGSHFQLTLGKVHAAGSTIAIGGLCGYGLEQTVDTINGIRQVFPVMGSYSPTGLYYAGSLMAIVGQTGQTSAFLNYSGVIVAASRTAGVVTLTTAANLADVNGLTMTVAGVTDSGYNGTFPVTTTGSTTLTYTQAGPDSTSAGGTVSILTGGYALYPMAEVMGVLNPATKRIDGQMTLAPNTVAWASGDLVEQPHYFQQQISGDGEFISQFLPRPTSLQSAGPVYQGINGPGLVGYSVQNNTPITSYIGAGGTHNLPTAGFSISGAWDSTMLLDAGRSSVFTLHCNLHGCNRWNSGYDLFQLYSATGVDTVHYAPQTSALSLSMRGAGYSFTPQAFTAGTINATTINAGTINGSVSGNAITSGAVSAAFLPLLGASGASHAAGIAPDPGGVAGITRFFREDGTWAPPGGTGAGGGNLIAGASADYNFLQGSGTSVLDTSGNGNNGTLVAGAAPTWTTTGLAFLPTQGVSLPATLNATQTLFAAVYINPITSGGQITNPYPVLLSSSGGGSGFNLMYSLYSTAGRGFIPNAYAPTLYVNNQAATVTPNLIAGFHVLAVSLGSGSGSTDHVYIDGVEIASYTAQGSSAGAQTTGNLFLGSSGINPWTSSGFNGTIYRLRTYPTLLSAAAVQSITTAITNEVAGRGVAITPALIALATPQLHAIGDSITFGQGITTPWPSLLTLTNQPAYTITDWGITGITLAAITGSEPNRAALRCHSSAGPQIAVIFAGTNDFALLPVSPAAIFSNLLGEVQTMKQAGCKVFVGTMLSRTGNDPAGSSLDADKDAYDAIILAQAKAGGADGIIDFAANPALGADGANAGSAFQGDHIHPTQAGAAMLAAAASNVLNYTFGANETSPHTVTSLDYAMTAADGYLSLAGVTSSGTLTLPDCTGQSGAAYRINNPQAAFTITVAPLNSSQLINGLSTATVPSNATLTLRDVPNPKTTAGCHWEM